MDLVHGLSIEESIAYELADIAIKLHKRGLIGPYQKVVKARDALLLILDKKEKKSSEQEKVNKKNILVQSDIIPLVEPKQLQQDTKNRKLEYAVA